MHLSPLLLQNEEILKKATSDYQEKLKKSEEKYRLLKKHAEEKIERFVLIWSYLLRRGTYLLK